MQVVNACTHLCDRARAKTRQQNRLPGNPAVKNMAAIEKLEEGELLLVFSHLSLRDLCLCCCVCKRWERIIQKADDKLWRPWFLRLPKAVRTSAVLRDCLPNGTRNFHRAALRAHANSWGSHSNNMFLSEDCFQVTRRPVAQSTDCARTKRGFRSGQHSWKVRWPSSPGSEAVLGKFLGHVINGRNSSCSSGGNCFLCVCPAVPYLSSYFSTRNFRKCQKFIFSFAEACESFLTGCDVMYVSLEDVMFAKHVIMVWRMWR